MNMPPSDQQNNMENEKPPVASFPGAVDGAAGPGNIVSTEGPQKNKSKRKLVAAAAAVAVVLAAGGFVFGYYLPNKPENVWKTGINRTGDALGKIVDESTKQENIKKLENSEIKADLEAKGGGADFSGTLTAKTDKNSTDGKLDVKFSAQGQQQNITAKFLSEYKEGESLPDSYINVTGLKALGVDMFVPGISNYEGKWIEISADYIRSLDSELAKEDKSNTENISAEDVASAAKAATEVTNQYVFTTDPANAVLENPEFVGKEDLDGTTYRYKVGINEQNAKNYCKALSERLINEAIYKKVTNVKDSQKQAKIDEAKKSCEQEDYSDTKGRKFDVWIDGKYKLLRKVKFTDKDNDKNYLELGQVYKGGDELTFFFASHTEESNSTTDIDGRFEANIKQSTSSGEVKAKTTGNSAFEGKITFSAKPTEGEVNIEKPAGAVKFQDMLKKLGLQ